MCTSAEVVGRSRAAATAKFWPGASAFSRENADLSPLTCSQSRALLTPNRNFFAARGSEPPNGRRRHANARPLDLACKAAGFLATVMPTQLMPCSAGVRWPAQTLDAPRAKEGSAGPERRYHARPVNPSE